MGTIIHEATILGFKVTGEMLREFCCRRMQWGNGVRFGFTETHFAWWWGGKTLSTAFLVEPLQTSEVKMHNCLRSAPFGMTYSWHTLVAACHIENPPSLRNSAFAVLAFFLLLIFCFPNCCVWGLRRELTSLRVHSDMRWHAIYAFWLQMWNFLPQSPCCFLQKILPS